MELLNNYLLSNRVNVIQGVYLTKFSLDYLRESHGTILAVSSVAGDHVPLLVFTSCCYVHIRRMGGDYVILSVLCQQACAARYTVIITADAILLCRIF